jgi:ssDNA-binding Zn-finger/Zn-ribbon topoisomerase 1
MQFNAVKISGITAQKKPIKKTCSDCSSAMMLFIINLNPEFAYL